MVKHKIPQKLLVIIVVLLPVAPLFAQFDFPPMGGRSAAMGGASVALREDESAQGNIAAMAWMRQVMVATAFRQTFVSEGFGTASLAASSPVGFGTAGLSFIHYGNSDYHEQQLSLLYALPVSRTVAMGVAFHYLHSGTSDAYYDPVNLLTFSAALQYSPTDELTVGFKTFNPFSVKLRDDLTYRTPALFTLGVAYRLIDELLAVAEAEKDLYNDATLRFGLEYSFLNNYAVRVGFNTNPVIYSFGVGMDFNRLGISLSAQVHNVLGITPHLSAHYRF